MNSTNVPDDARQQMMSKAVRTGFAQRGDEGYRVVTSAAESARERGHYFTAGYLWTKATDTAWGNPDRMVDAVRRAADYYKLGLEQADACSSLALAMRIKAAQLYHNAIFDRSDAAVQVAYRAALSEMAAIIVTCFADSSQCDSWLIRGAVSNLRLSDESVDVQFPEHEVDWTSEMTAADVVTIGIPSAFQLMSYLRDYAGAIEVAELCPTGFTGPTLLGWKEAALGFLDRDDGAQHFAGAASYFSQDTTERANAEGRAHWNGINVGVWAPYFEARAAVARIRTSPADVRALLAEAARILRIEDIHWTVPEVRRLAVLVRALDRLISPESGTSVDDVRQQFLQDAAMSATEDDPLIGDFLNLAGPAFDGFSADPAREVGSGRLHAAIDKLSRITAFQSQESSALAPALQQSAVDLVRGLDKTWIHRNLEAITDEDVLRRLLLRLLQAELPVYAQVVHGPIEYGRDVVVLTRESDGRLLLRMYQVKRGEIDTNGFQQASNQLEKMFLVPTSSFQLGIDNEPVREGILICNGHAGPHVEPVMKGWFETELKDHGRRCSFMHLDSWVQWIVEKNLLSTFRHALMELGVYQR